MNQETVNFGDMTTKIKNEISKNPVIQGQEFYDELIPLHSLNGEQYAFFAPLKADGEYKGYVILGAVNDYFETLVTAQDEVGLAEYIVQLSNNYEIIFEFPFSFFVRNDNNIYHVTTDLSLSPIDLNSSKTENSPQSKSSAGLLEGYTKNINITEYLKNKSESSSLVTPLAISNEAKLTMWDQFQFVPVKEGTGYYYGGFQGWLANSSYITNPITQHLANRSCGVTAASNLLHYFAKEKGKSVLYAPATNSINDFTKHMRSVYEYLSPALWGIPGIDRMKTGVMDYGLSKGIYLTPVLDNSSFTKANVVNYIRTGLNSNSPVLLVTWDTDVSDLGWHWVTLTRYYEDAGTRYITTSNWAGKVTYSFDAWFDAGSMYMGVLYFK